MLFLLSNSKHTIIRLGNKWKDNIKNMQLACIKRTECLIGTLNGKTSVSTAVWFILRSSHFHMDYIRLLESNLTLVPPTLIHLTNPKRHLSSLSLRPSNDRISISYRQLMITIKYQESNDHALFCITLKIRLHCVLHNFFHRDLFLA